MTEDDLLAAANEHFATTRELREDEIAAWDGTAADELPAQPRTPVHPPRG